VTVRLIDLVARKTGPMSDLELKQLEEWIEADWESCDLDRRLIALIVRMIHTVEARSGKG
jgi:hypothetical protein